MPNKVAQQTHRGEQASELETIYRSVEDVSSKQTHSLNVRDIREIRRHIAAFDEADSPTYQLTSSEMNAYMG